LIFSGRLIVVTSVFWLVSMIPFLIEGLAITIIITTLEWGEKQMK